MKTLKIPGFRVLALIGLSYCLFGDSLNAPLSATLVQSDDDVDYDIINQNAVDEVYDVNRYSSGDPDIYNNPGNTQQGTLNNYYQYRYQKLDNEDK